MAEAEPPAPPASAAGGGGGGGGGQKGRGLKAIQAELLSAKKRWPGAECKAATAPKGSEGAPFPISLARTCPAPGAGTSTWAWDVEELRVKLVIERKPTAEDAAEGGALPVHVEVPTGQVPPRLAKQIVAKLDALWRSELARNGPAKGWLLEKLLRWVASHVEDLLKLDPSLIEMYVGCDAEGNTQRRFTLIEPADEEEEEEERETEAEREAREERERQVAANARAMEERRLQREAEAERQARIDAARKKEIALSGRPSDEAGHRTVQISKKTQQAMLDAKRNKQGVRTAKTGARAKKFDAEALKQAEVDKKKDKAKAKAERAKKRDDEKLAEQRSLCPAGKKRVKKKEDDEIVVTY